MEEADVLDGLYVATKPSTCLVYKQFKLAIGSLRIPAESYSQPLH